MYSISKNVYIDALDEHKIHIIAQSKESLLV